MIIAARLAYATGCALMVKRRVFEVIPGFDPSFKNLYGRL